MSRREHVGMLLVGLTFLCSSVVPEGLAAVAKSSSPSPDLLAVTELLKALGGAASLGPWDGANPCSLRGVQCGNATSPSSCPTATSAAAVSKLGTAMPRVTAISWPSVVTSGGMRLGPLPASVGNLSCLSALDLSGNSIRGSLPPQLSLLYLLQSLSLRSNSLTGAIPVSYSSLRVLSQLKLARNFLTGALPSGVSALPLLRQLDIGYNALSLVQTPSPPAPLLQLVAAHNSLYGPLDFLLGFPHLTLLDVGSNQLSGGIEPLTNLTKATYIDVSANRLRATIPAAFQQLPSLVAFFARDNELFGLVPSPFVSLIRPSGLRLIDIANNYFAGKPPPSPTGYGLSDYSGNCFNPYFRKPGDPPSRDAASCRDFYNISGTARRA